MKDKAGFTLTEVLIAIVVVAVLAGLALPNYFRTVELARSNEATTNLRIIHAAQKIYHLNNNTYWPAGSSSSVLATINTNLNTDLSTQFYNTLQVSAGSGTGNAATFTAEARRGNPGDKRFSITQTGTISESGTY